MRGFRPNFTRVAMCFLTLTLLSGMGLMIYSFIDKAGLNLLLFGVTIALTSTALCLIVICNQPSLSSRRSSTCECYESSEAIGSAFQMGSPPSYEEVVRNPRAFPKTDQFTGNSRNIEAVDTTTATRVNWSEATSADGLPPSYCDVVVTAGSHSIEVTNTTTTRVNCSEGTSADGLPPSYYDEVVVAGSHSSKVTHTTTTLSQVDCSEGTPGNIQESCNVDLHSHADQNITVMRTVQDEEELPPSYDQVTQNVLNNACFVLVI